MLDVAVGWPQWEQSELHFESQILRQFNSLVYDSIYAILCFFFLRQIDLVKFMA